MLINQAGSGGGAGGFNFKVIAVSSLSALPSSAAENTIAVATTTAITSYVFKTDTPSSPTEGMVWFHTGTTSLAPFNALKKNGIWVYPTACQQYVSGSWATKGASSYQNGKWNNWWDGTIYNYGARYDFYTGTLTGKAIGINSVWSPAPRVPNITYNSNNIAIGIYGSAVENKSGLVYYPTPIDLTNYTNLNLVKSQSFSDAGASFKLWVSKSVPSNFTDVGTAVQSSYNDSDSQKNLSVSALTGKYYIGLALCDPTNAGSNMTLNVYKLKLS